MLQTISSLVLAVLRVSLEVFKVLAPFLWGRDNAKKKQLEDEVEDIKDANDARNELNKPSVRRRM